LNALRIRSSLHADGLASLAANQVNAMFPDGAPVAAADLAGAAAGALVRVEHCFSRVQNRYFFDGVQVVFDHLHGDQYAMWLYLLANELYRRSGPAHACKKLFLLNKALHGCDVYYEIELPSVFLFVHPLATVLGRARYSDYFLVYQRCGIGSNHDVYPTLGEFVTLRPGSAVLGSSRIGRNCTIAAEALVLDRDLADDVVYFGNPRDFATRAAGAPPSIWRT
jgi:serine O-acetyltransferase